MSYTVMTFPLTFPPDIFPRAFPLDISPSLNQRRRTLPRTVNTLLHAKPGNITLEAINHQHANYQLVYQIQSRRRFLSTSQLSLLVISFAD